MMWEENFFGENADCQLFFSYLTLAHEYLSKSFISYFKENCGFTPNQMSALCYLKLYDSLSMSYLAEKLNMSKQQTTQLVNSLVKKNWVERHYHNGNRRTIHITPTAQAVEMLRKGEMVYVNNALQQIKTLPTEEQQSMIDAMACLARTLPKLNFYPEAEK